MEGLGIVLLSAMLIFVLRLVDVSLGALRISMLFRGRSGLAGAFGFFESLTWLLAAALVLGNLDSSYKFIAYAGGFAAGTVLGSKMEQWLAIGDALVRIVTPPGSTELVGQLRDAGYFVTTVNAQGRDGEVQVNLSVMPRKMAPRLMAMVRQFCPESFVTYEETTPIRLATIPASRVRK